MWFPVPYRQVSNATQLSGLATIRQPFAKSTLWRQRPVNHVARTRRRYALLTSAIKLIRTALWHAPRNVRTQKQKSGRERIVRRQTELGGHSAGSSCTARLDPLAPPVRFTPQH